MNAASMNNLWSYLQGLSLTADNRKWLANKLIEHDKGLKTVPPTLQTFEEAMADLEESELEFRRGDDSAVHVVGKTDCGDMLCRSISVRAVRVIYTDSTFRAIASDKAVFTLLVRVKTGIAVLFISIVCPRSTCDGTDPTAAAHRSQKHTVNDIALA